MDGLLDASAASVEGVAGESDHVEGIHDGCRVGQLHDPAGEDRAAGLQQLAGDLQAELVEPTEPGQVRAGEPRHRGSIRHVEVFQMGSVRTSIIGRPRPLPGPTRRTAPYTLICDEPFWSYKIPVTGR